MSDTDINPETSVEPLRVKVCPECGDPVVDRPGSRWHRRCFAAQDGLPLWGPADY